jgi:FkbM family methyltransferase
MKDSKRTLLEVVRHIATSHPELAPTLEQLIFESQKKNVFDANLLLALNQSLIEKSRSQLRQDLFVLHELGWKRRGYFVEFGATNGVDLSNTYLLEKEYDWSGILAEPATLWHEELDKNRTAIIDKRCVWKKTGESLLFNETKNAELSTIYDLSSSDYHAKERGNGKKYWVETVSLTDLLDECKAPREIDYMSVDTEGSEFDILEGFDFRKYRVRVITCEHNYSPARLRLTQLLEKNGYCRKHESLSRFDDWWVLR